MLHTLFLFNWVLFGIDPTLSPRNWKFIWWYLNKRSYIQEESFKGAAVQTAVKMNSWVLSFKFNVQWIQSSKRPAACIKWAGDFNAIRSKAYTELQLSFQYVGDITDIAACLARGRMLRRQSVSGGFCQFLGARLDDSGSHGAPPVRCSCRVSFVVPVRRRCRLLVDCHLRRRFELRVWGLHDTRTPVCERTRRLSWHGRHVPRIV